MQINFNLRDNCHILQTTFTRFLTDQQKKVIIVVSAIFGLLAVFFIINLWRKVISLQERLKEIKIGKNDPEKKEEQVEKKEHLIIKNNENLQNTQILDDQLNPSKSENIEKKPPSQKSENVEKKLSNNPTTHPIIESEPSKEKHTENNPSKSKLNQKQQQENPNNLQILQNPSLQEPQKSASPTNIHEDVGALSNLEILYIDKLKAEIDTELIDLEQTKEIFKTFKKMIDNNQKIDLLMKNLTQIAIKYLKIKKDGEALVPLEDDLKRLDEDKKSLHENQSKFFEKILKEFEDREHIIQNKFTLVLKFKNAFIEWKKSLDEKQPIVREKLEELNDIFAELKNKCLK